MSQPRRLIPFYSLLEPLAQGGMAEVWRARQDTTGRIVAVKVLTYRSFRESAFQAALRNEARAAACLDHPNIIRLIDYGEIRDEEGSEPKRRLLPGSPYLVLEHVEGGELADLSRRRRWSQVKSLLLQLLSALAHAHARGIVHLDLKPSNVLLDRSPEGSLQPKLSDFGIAHLLNEALHDFTSMETPSAGDRATSRFDTAKGTPPFMAPEQIANAYRDFGPWTDLYALGCLAHWLVTGHPPFRGEVPEVVRAQLEDDPPDLPPETPVPPRFRRWLHRLLEKRPINRFQSAAAAAAALRDCDMSRSPRALAPRAPDPRPDSIVVAPPSEISARRLETLPSPEAFQPFLGETTAVEVDSPVRDAQGSKLARWQEGGRARFPQDKGPSLPSARHDTENPLRTAILDGVGPGLFGLRALPIVGRDAERDLLWSSLKAVEADGVPRLVVLQGPDGSGKSRLAEWLCHAAHERAGIPFLNAVHSPEEGPADGLPPMLQRALRCQNLDRPALFRRLRHRIDMLGGDVQTAQALTELLAPVGERATKRGDTHASARPDSDLTAADLDADAAIHGEQDAITHLLDLDPSLERPPRFAQPTERYELLRTVLTLLGGERPLILWLDDVQWGRDTLEFADYVLKMRTVSPAPLLLLMTCGTEELSTRHVEHDTLDRMLTLPGATRITLTTLQDKDIMALCTRHIGLAHALAQDIVRHAGGSPLFALQIVGDWLRAGVLKPSAQGLIATRDVRGAFPRSLRKLWDVRLRRLLEGLSRDAEKALELAAVLGQQVLADEWTLLCRLTSISVPRGLVDRLITYQLVNPIERDRVDPRPDVAGWSFSHISFREHLEARIKAAGRWEAHHRACAEMLTRRYPEPSPRVNSRKARHLVAAGEIEEALPLVLKAARGRVEDADFGEAHALLDLYERTLAEHPRQDDERLRIEGRIVRVLTQLSQGHYKDGLALAQSIEAALRDGTWPDLRAEALLYTGWGYAAAWKLAEAEEALERALGLFESLGNRAGMARCLRRMGYIHLEMHRLDRATELHQRGLRIADELGDLYEQAGCLAALGVGARLKGDFDRSERCHRGALVLYRAVGARGGVADSLWALGKLAQDRNDRTLAVDILKRAGRLLGKLGLVAPLAALHNDLADLARSEGDYLRAEQEYRKAIALMETQGSERVLTIRINLMILQLSQRRLDKACAMLSTLMDAPQATLVPEIHAAVVAVGLACAAHRRDWKEWDRRSAELHDLGDTLEIVGPDHAEPLQIAAELALAAGQTTRGTKALRLALSFWRRQNAPERAKDVETTLKGLDTHDVIAAASPSPSREED